MPRSPPLDRILANTSWTITDLNAYMRRESSHRAFKGYASGFLNIRSTFPCALVVPIGSRPPTAAIVAFGMITPVLSSFSAEPGAMARGASHRWPVLLAHVLVVHVIGKHRETELYALVRSKIRSTRLDIFAQTVRDTTRRKNGTEFDDSIAANKSDVYC